MALGAEKYGAYNWRKKNVAYTVYISATMRHLYAALDGEDHDPESGALHLAHARACMGILIDAIHSDAVVDDRPPAGPAPRVIAALTKPIDAS